MLGLYGDNGQEMEKKMETTTLAYIGFRVPPIMENQMEKNIHGNWD